MLYSYILIALLIFSISLLFTIKIYKNKTNYKGKLGEKIVSDLLGKTIEGEKYIINDLCFNDENNNSCQIDHVYINKFGIFVLETKNYAGYIFGKENQREWTQTLSYGRIKNKFYNPVKQNNVHILKLSKKLKKEGIYHNIVVFLNKADISNVYSNNVYTTRSLLNALNAQRETLLSPQEMEYYYNQILKLKLDSTVSEKDHILYVQNNKNKIEANICPRCGGRLVLRNGKNGKFYGCSNYPKCKFTKPYSSTPFL